MVFLAMVSMWAGIPRCIISSGKLFWAKYSALHWSFGATNTISHSSLVILSLITFLKWIAFHTPLAAPGGFWNFQKLVKRLKFVICKFTLNYSNRAVNYLIEQLHIKANQFTRIDAVRCKIKSLSIDSPKISPSPTIPGMYIYMYIYTGIPKNFEFKI